MKIVSLVIKFLPQHAAQVREDVHKVPGASVKADSGAGKMIVLLEDGPDYAVSDSILGVHHVANVMSVTLAYEYSDDEAPLSEAPVHRGEVT
ncbi:MAG: chaperone NapD [Azoarcus sp.]|jgi:nitrate reductase NapD|nr:chaperone NapD [Azoarcus sp.]